MPVVPSLFLDDVLELLDPAPEARGRALGETAWDDAPAPSARTARLAAAAARGDAAPRPHPIAPLSDADVLAALAGRETWSASALELWVSLPGQVVRPAAAAARGDRPRRRGAGPRSLRPRGARARDRRPGARRRPGRADAADASACPRAAARGARRARGRTPHQRQPPAPARGGSPPGGRPRRATSTTPPTRAARSRRAAISRGHASAAATRRDRPRGSATARWRLAGRIDRVDLAPGGDQAIIYDYKGKSAPPAARWLADGKLQIGPLHARRARAAGARVVGGLYQPLGGDEHAPARRDRGRRRPRPARRQQRPPRHPRRSRSCWATCSTRRWRSWPRSAPGAWSRARRRAAGASRAARIRRSAAARRHDRAEPARPSRPTRSRGVAAPARRRQRRLRQDVGARRALRAFRARRRLRARRDPRDHVHREGGGRAARRGVRRELLALGAARAARGHRGGVDLDDPRVLRARPARARRRGRARPALRRPRRGRAARAAREPRSTRRWPRLVDDGRAEALDLAAAYGARPPARDGRRRVYDRCAARARRRRGCRCRTWTPTSTPLRGRGCATRRSPARRPRSRRAPWRCESVDDARAALARRARQLPRHEACERAVGRRLRALPRGMAGLRAGERDRRHAPPPRCALIDELLAALRRRVRGRQARRASGLDFDDLELLRARPAAPRPGVARALRRALRARSWSTSSRTRTRSSSRSSSASSRDNVFVVGDELQSIYGFRHADVGSSAAAARDARRRRGRPRDAGRRTSRSRRGDPAGAERRRFAPLLAAASASPLRRPAVDRRAGGRRRPSSCWSPTARAGTADDARPRRAAGRAAVAARRGAARRPARARADRRRRAAARRHRRAPARRHRLARCRAGARGRGACRRSPSAAAASGRASRSSDLRSLSARARQPARRGGAARRPRLAAGRRSAPTPWRCSRQAARGGRARPSARQLRTTQATACPTDDAGGDRRRSRRAFAAERELAPRLGARRAARAHRRRHRLRPARPAAARAARAASPTCAS